MDHLAAAQRALRDPPDRPTALDHLIRAWRKHDRHPELARLVEALSAESARTLEPLDPTLGDADYHATWITRAAHARLIDVEVLLPGLFRGPLGTRISERFELIAAFADDPRVSAAFGRMIAAPPVTSASNFPLWTLLFTALHRVPDIRLRPVLEQRISTPNGGSQFWPMLQQRCLALLRELPEQVPPLNLSVRPQAAALRERIATLARHELGVELRSTGSYVDIEAGLLAQVYAEPHVLEHRMVWADALQTRGDPRGEFVQLQLTRAAAGRKPSMRERSLLNQFEVAWLAELAPLVDRKRLRWANGFPVQAEVVFSSQTERELIGREIWATFEELDCEDFELITSPVLRSIRRVGCFGLDTLLALAQAHGSALPLEQLGPVDLRQNPPPEVHGLHRAPAERLLAVRELWLHQAHSALSRAPRAFDWLFSTPLGGRLTRFRLSAVMQLEPGVQATEWVDWIAARARWSLERLRLDIGLLSVELCEAGQLRVRTKLSGDLGHLYDDVIRDQLAAFRAEFPRLQLISCGSQPVSPETLARWAEVAGFLEFEHRHRPSKEAITSHQASELLGAFWARQRTARTRIARGGRLASTTPRIPRRYGPGPTGPWVALEGPEQAPRLRASASLNFDRDALLVADEELAGLHVPELQLAWSLHDRNRSSLSSCAYDPRARHLWIGTTNGATILWDVVTRRELGRARFHINQVTAVAIADRRMYSADRDRKLHLWAEPAASEAREPAMLIPERTVSLDAGPSAMVIDPAGLILALLTNSRVQLRQLDQPTRRHDIGPASQRHSILAWSPEGDHLIAGQADGTLLVWDRDGALLTRLRIHDHAVHGVAWTPDGAQLITIGDDADGPAIRVSDRETGQLCLRIQPTRPGTLTKLAVSTDGRYVAASADAWVGCWSLDDGVERGLWEYRAAR